MTSKECNHTKNKDSKIGFIPVLSEQSIEQLIQQIYQSIVDKATTVDFYHRLVKEVTSDLHKEFIKHVYEDELVHLEAYKKLYEHLALSKPQYEINPVHYATYKEGVLIALKRELDSAKFYRNMILATTNPVVKDTFSYALIDEIEHSTQFGVLFNTLS